ncbi:Hydrogen peroxide induced protein 1 [Rhynchospora pubera]|uniref:Hydrogen peroxide induced protein 1 n=1 Tax=Rhynchospora pubera TaxID=906938 RepID=A0AAV8H9Q9_9POAL|nr:Hydrogen peroxide induced protein 1 [Rhynchospora pubera]
MRANERDIDRSCIKTFLSLSLSKQNTVYLLPTIPIPVLHCMAANLKARGIAGTIGKRFVNHILSPTPAVPISASRSVHASTYDKEIEEQVRPSVVPDEVIDTDSDKYWGPNPNTGVFGPANPAVSARPTGQSQIGGGTGSVLDQKVSYRASDDMN